MNTIKEYETSGYKVSVYQDEHAEGPDNWGNDDCFLVYDHRQFNVEVKGFDPEDIFQHINEHKVFFYNGYFVFPVFAYIHSGVALSLGKTSYPFNCQFDTSYRGFALVKRVKGWSYARTKALKIAESVVSEWNQYLSGDVYGYMIEDKDGEIVDSCSGFYGFEYVQTEAEAMVKYHIGEAFKKRCNDLKVFIRNRVPLHVRQENLYA